MARSILGHLPNSRAHFVDECREANRKPSTCGVLSFRRPETGMIEESLAFGATGVNRDFGVSCGEPSSMCLNVDS